jgi:hypothetical protein
VPAELCGLRVGAFRLVTFPGELVADVGIRARRAAGDDTAFVAGYTNGYLHYLPTPAQRRNSGFAQEDCDCQVGPEWEGAFMDAAAAMFERIGAAPGR